MDFIAIFANGIINNNLAPMKRTRILMMLTLLIVAAGNISGQTENPRGIYKMVKTTTKSGEIVEAPLDQYKLCGDSVCLMLIVNERKLTASSMFVFDLYSPDRQVFNYTGDRSAEKMGVWIYDSNAEHFTLKWYSAYSFQPWFPEGGWVTEWYERRVPFSENANCIFNGLMTPNGKSKGDFNGLWKVVSEDGFQVYKIVNNNHVITFIASGVNNQGQLMRLSGVIMPAVFQDADMLVINNQKNVINLIDENTVNLIADETNLVETWKRSELPPAYKNFFRDFKR